MRIYKRSEFLKLPVGTIYAKGKPMYFDALSIKGDMCGENDWAELSPMWISASGDDEQWARLDGMIQRGESYPMAEHYGRDGCFDDDAIFLVPEYDDLLKLRTMVDAAIECAKR